MTPGFIHMTEEYLRAREVFRLFRGNPSHVEDFPGRTAPGISRAP